MVMDVSKEQICINQLLGTEKNVFQVENDIIVNDVKPDVLAIIDTNGILCVNKKEIIDGKVKLDGEIEVFLIYLADGEKSEVRSLKTCLNFSQTLELKDYNENMNVNIKCKLKDLEAKIINGRKINLKATIEVKSSLSSETNMQIVNNLEDLENLEVLKNTKQLVSCIGRGTTKVNAKDTISIDEENQVAEIMNFDIRLLNKDIKTSYNKVLLKGDAVVQILYLTEDNRINKVDTQIPVMGFIDMQDIKEDCIFNEQEELSNLIINQNNLSEHSIAIEAEFTIHIEAFEKKELNIATDLYSLNANATSISKTVNTIVLKDNIKDTLKISETIQDASLNDSKIYCTEVQPIINNENVRNGKVIYDGNILIKILYGENEVINMKQFSIPFNFEMCSNEITEKSIINTEINVENDNFIIQNDNIDVSMTLEFNISLENSNELNLIEDINIEEITEKNPYSMVIYFVKPGDTLWKIAKKFKTTVRDIARVNEIENENKINIGEQLYIPKFVRTNG